MGRELNPRKISIAREMDSGGRKRPQKPRASVSFAPIVGLWRGIVQTEKLDHEMTMESAACVAEALLFGSLYRHGQVGDISRVIGASGACVWSRDVCFEGIHVGNQVVTSVPVDRR